MCFLYLKNLDFISMLDKAVYSSNSLKSVEVLIQSNIIPHQTTSLSGGESYGIT